VHAQQFPTNARQILVRGLVQVLIFAPVFVGMMALWRWCEGKLGLVGWSRVVVDCVGLATVWVTGILWFDAVRRFMAKRSYSWLWSKAPPKPR
jgi:hypothetical protein